jgi:hypothetical protein
MYSKFFLLFIPLFSFAQNISFINDIKPILDSRCVVCHSCYNSPCQTKFSSYEGIDRGGSKTTIYENRIKPIEPARIFIDATTTSQWREKGFYSIIEPLNKNNDSIMSLLLEQKQKFPNSKGSYEPEKDKLTCSKNYEELLDYISKKPYHGMPYGFPALSEKEHEILLKWLKSGAKNDEIKDLEKSDEMKLFEKFLNNKDIKHQISARYIYEHLFLAHLKFEDSDGFYELIRSYDKQGLNPVNTRLPYGKPKKEFYYILRKISSTIVHKTHMVYKINKNTIKRYEELFINPKWPKKPTKISYEPLISANPLTAFEQIPLEARYNFLLDDIKYFIMTFIRGPVCKGQIALNVINDHFWIAFKDPKYDETILNKEFIKQNQKNLSLPNEYGSDTSILDSFDFVKYDKVTVDYYKNKNILYKNKQHKLDLKTIWKGNKPNTKNNDAILTIYRHFDSASVHNGALGNTPKTMWVIDYPLLERLYYSLVAGFDVFGNTQHKVLVRKYMDRLRIEGESNFLEYIPKQNRKEIFDSWYKGLLVKYFVTYTPSNNSTNIIYKTKDYKNELIEKILEYTNTKKDEINYIKTGYKKTALLDKYDKKEHIEISLKDLTLIDNLKNYKEFSSSNFNLIYIRFELKSEDLIYSVVINRWHDNVAFLFDEDERLDKTKDSINIIEGFIGSYPNYFVVVKHKDISEFFHLLKNYTNDENELSKFFIRRDDKRFWETYDWFQTKFNESNPIEAGLFDLNRYYHKTFN